MWIVYKDIILCRTFSRGATPGALLLWLLWGHGWSGGPYWVSSMLVQLSTFAVNCEILSNASVFFRPVGHWLDWISPFLAKCSSCVVLGASKSLWVLTAFGLLQVSILASLLCWLYTYNFDTLLSYVVLLYISCRQMTHRHICTALPFLWLGPFTSCNRQGGPLQIEWCCQQE